MSGSQRPSSPKSVNSQITDAISQTNTLTLGLAPAQSIGMLYQTTAQAVGASMQNAVANQQNLQSLNMAALTQNLQAILKNALVTLRPVHHASVISTAPHFPNHYSTHYPSNDRKEQRHGQTAPAPGSPPRPAQQ